MFYLVDRFGNENSPELLARQIHRSLEERILSATLVDTRATSQSASYIPAIAAYVSIMGPANVNSSFDAYIFAYTLQ
jgi:hypothetical protein